MRIHTERLILREFCDADWLAVHGYASDAEVVRYQDWGPNSEQQTKEFIARTIEAAAQPRSDYTLAVELAQFGVLIGGCGIVLDVEHRSGVIGYSLARQYWGHGYATEAAGALLRFGFESLGLHRICATTDARNTASWRVMEKLGMRREGHFREDLWQRGGWRDSFLYAILECQWNAGEVGNGGR
jgi:RimJ/RimL family protein N-acetyltransferase